MRIITMEEADWPAVAGIYAEGIATGHATFAGAPPDSFAEFCEGRIRECSIVAKEDHADAMLGWATLAKVSDRCVYAGVAEISVYVAHAARHRGVGSALLREIIARADAAEIWTLQASIFEENEASGRLHQRFGFRLVGRRERIGKMTHGPKAGQWRDTLLWERRSTQAGQA